MLSLIKIRSALISAMLALITVSCVKPNVSLIRSAESTSLLKVYLKNLDANSHLLLVSTPTVGGVATYCTMSEDGCVNEVDLDRVGEVGNREIFGLNNLTASPTKQHRITIKTSAGEINRNFTFSRSSNGSETGSWKAVFLSGDYRDNGQSIPAWDNARRDLADLMKQRGFEENNIAHISRDPTVVAQDPTIKDSSLAAIEQSLTELNIGSDDRCFLFMTSHGSRSSFYIEGRPGISPTKFGQLLDAKCGNRKTVAIVSACYAGVMLTDQVKRDNRIVFTASSANKTSFGCQPGVTYTHFDECTVNAIKRESVETYEDLQRDIEQCIIGKEGSLNQSSPQFYIGSNMANTPLDANGDTSGGGGYESIQDFPDGRSERADESNQSSTADSATVNEISGTANLSLRGTAGPTDLKTIAEGKKYLLIDFSQPTCGYCIQFAATVEQNQDAFGESCKAVTLVGPGQLNGWVSRAQGQAPGIGSHSYELSSGNHGTALTALSGEQTSQVPTPTILLYDVAAGQMVTKQAGALQAGALRNLLQGKCGG